MKKLWFWAVVVISFFAIWGTFGLARTEWMQGDVCPKILGIPACYIVLVCFTIALLSHVIPFPKNRWIYFLFVGLVTAIASTGTLGEILGFAKCPRTASGIPMCFISLGICLSLLITKYLSIKRPNVQQKTL